MKNTAAIIIIVLVLILCAGLVYYTYSGANPNLFRGLGKILSGSQSNVATSSTLSSNTNSQDNNIVDTNYSSTLDNPQSQGICGSSTYPCFKYPEVSQTSGQGDLENINQSTLYPCPAPKRICPLCGKEVVAQTSGAGQDNSPVQVQVNC